MSKTEISKLRFRYKYFFIIIFVFIMGLIFLIVSQNITVSDTAGNGKFWKLLFEQLATAMLVGGLISGLYEYFLRQEFIDNTEQQTTDICARINKLGEDARIRADKIADYLFTNAEMRELGVSHCYKEVDRYDFTSDIEDTEKFTVVLNDGRGWVGNYYQRFLNRFDHEDDERETTIILMHPNSPAIDLHAHKVGSTAEGVRMKIAETIRLLHKANNKNRKLTILGHPYYTTMSIFLGEKEAIVTPYFLAKVRRTPPILTFIENGRDSFYHKLKEDVEALMLDCQDISQYTREDGTKI